ncbi:hypothetical protein V8C26DRAFT_394308 [Trichoderma gracile]
MQHHLVDSPGPGPVCILVAEGRGIGRLSLLQHDRLLHVDENGMPWPAPGRSGFARNSGHTGAGITRQFTFRIVDW